MRRFTLALLILALASVVPVMADSVSLHVSQKVPVTIAPNGPVTGLTCNCADFSFCHFNFTDATHGDIVATGIGSTTFQCSAQNGDSVTIYSPNVAVTVTPDPASSIALTFGAPVPQ